ncbi:MAG: quinolinate synthase NadA [Peptoniphilus sp.]|nr:quinolinate synthase NadA [Peptoniphilus sp.]MDD7362644.1 quinolinate synthase NadA [Bacillota bacterium]MDY6044957.1 quinolinate synthase NadA [Peptoniphilus sp.]
MDLHTLDQLKKEKDCILLAHYYVDGDVQAAADYVGDSFTLAKTATQVDAEHIIMAGVQFMGETVKILNPDKHVYLPDLEADCPMAHMVDVDKIEAMREKYDDLAVVCYVNSTAEIKAHSDYCCTSSNAAKIVAAIDSKHIFFIPDGNLGRNIQSQFPDKEFIFNDGCCPVHDEISAEEIKSLKAQYPGAPVFVHPECKPEVLALADYAGSTKGILKAVADFDKETNIIVTEEGLLWELEQTYPGKTFVFPDMICEDMKKITLEEVVDILNTGKNEIDVDPKLAERAKVPLDRMLDICG